MPAVAQQPLSTENRLGLERQGFSIQNWIGFNDHFVPLYTHKDVSDKKRGDILGQVRLGNPKTINDAEASYLARKASQGFFLWKPDECLTHKFRNVNFTKDNKGQTVVDRSEVYMGCKWCRDFALAEVKAKEERERVRAEIVEAARQPDTVVELPEEPRCDACFRVFNTHHGLKIHKTRCTVTVVTPPEGSAGEVK